MGRTSGQQEDRWEGWRGNHLLPLLRTGHGEGCLHGGCESQPGLEDRASNTGDEVSMLSLS